MGRKPTASPKRRRPRTPAASKTKGTGVRTLERRLARVSAEREAERKRYARQLASLRREADRRLANMVQEIARLRHHEARVEALSRLVAERDSALAAQAERIERLESLLQKAPDSG
jgi:hypothetical protein